jgi:hypothetical protein
MLCRDWLGEAASVAGPLESWYESREQVKPLKLRARIGWHDAFLP